MQWVGYTDIVVFCVFVFQPSTETAAYHKKYSQSNLSQMETMLRAKGGGEEALSQDQERLLHRELQVFIFVTYF